MLVWCGRRDLNPYSFQNTPLKRARMPIPPRPQRQRDYYIPPFPVCQQKLEKNRQLLRKGRRPPRRGVPLSPRPENRAGRGGGQGISRLSARGNLQGAVPNNKPLPKSFRRLLRPILQRFFHLGITKVAQFPRKFRVGRFGHDQALLPVPTGTDPRPSPISFQGEAV